MEIENKFCIRCNRFVWSEIIRMGYTEYVKCLQCGYVTSRSEASKVSKEVKEMSYQEGKPTKQFRFTIIAGSTNRLEANYTNRRWWNSEKEATEEAERFFNESTREIREELVVVEAKTILRPKARVEVEKINLKGK